MEGKGREEGKKEEWFCVSGGKGVEGREVEGWRVDDGRRKEGRMGEREK